MWRGVVWVTSHRVTISASGADHHEQPAQTEPRMAWSISRAARSEGIARSDGKETLEYRFECCDYLLNSPILFMSRITAS